MEQTIAARLVDFNYDLVFDDVPSETVGKAKRLILDTIGICVGSTRLDFGLSTLELVGAWGGGAESTLIGGTGRSSAHYAAFCNGVLGHGQDFDDTHTESVVHPSAALVPVALAIGERANMRGRDVLANLIGGLETTIRLGMPARNAFHLRGFHTTSVCATFGSAIMSSVGGELSRALALQAVGIGGSFASGLLECVPAKSTGKRLHAGWAGLCGIVASDLARSGFTGPATVFEGKLGVYNSFLRGEALDLDEICDGLGDRWEMLDIAPKLYPCCHYLQAFLDCAGELRRENSLRPEQIAYVRCHITEGAVNMVCEPWAEKLEPKTGYDMRFSLPFAVSAMLSRGRAGIAEFSPDMMEDAEIRSLMARVSYLTDPAFTVKDMPARIEIGLTDGRVVTSEVPRVRGDYANPVSDDELLRKFHANTQSLGRECSERLAERILSFEEGEGLDDIMSDLRAGAQPSGSRTAVA